MPVTVPPLSVSPTVDNKLLWDVWLSGFRLPALTAADELGIFTHLAEKPSTAPDLACDMNLGERSVSALLQLLASLGILDKKFGVFSLNQVSRTYLLPESEDYWGGVLHSVRVMPVSHDMIMQAIRRDSGKDTEARGFRRFTDDWLQESLSHEQAAAFTAKMHSHGFSAARALARNPVFSGTRRLLDIGGGSGSYSIAFAAAHPEITCTVADLPAVCPHTSKYIAAYHLEERVKTFPFNMFDNEWPAGHDTVFMSDILHDWGQEDCCYLLSRAFACLPTGGWLRIHEVLLEDDSAGPVTASAYSLAMLMGTEGKQFCFREIELLLSECGFIDITQSDSHGYYSLVSARKP